MSGELVDVLIVGAGPTGLTAAIAARQQGLSVRIVDRARERSPWSKALVLHSRSMEVFDHLGCIAPMLEAGRDFRVLNIIAKDGPVARVRFSELAWGDVAFPRWWTIEQSSTERCLEEHLERSGVRVERGASVSEVREQNGVVRAVIERDGEREEASASWLIGCDGARSDVRRCVGVEMDGTSSESVFVLADVEVESALNDAEGYNVLSEQGVLLLVPLEKPGRIRVIAHRPDLKPGDEPAIDGETLQALMDERSPIAVRVKSVGWTSRFVARHALARRYRVGRVFLAGDAAHLHSPVGGQGLNTGIQDAYNLLWKIALVHRGRAGDALLESYERERRSAAEEMVRSVKLATRALTVQGRGAIAVRNRVARFALGRNAVRDRMGAAVGMLRVRYAEGPMIAAVRERSLRCDGANPGQRAPQCASVAELREVFRGTESIVLVFDGDADEVSARASFERAREAVGDAARVVRVRAGRERRNEPWELCDGDRRVHEAYGAREPLLVWVRPDRVIGLRARATDVRSVREYIARWSRAKGAGPG
ncbi:MAG: FAD-dependent monooxygenase [Polyangiales bacterium]